MSCAVIDGMISRNAASKSVLEVMEWVDMMMLFLQKETMCVVVDGTLTCSFHSFCKLY